MKLVHQRLGAIFAIFAVGCSQQGAGELTLDGESSRSAEVGELRQALTAADIDCSTDPRVLAQLVTLQECKGANRFFRKSFGGNGRACSTCHRVEDNYTISPEFIGALPPDDPLFVAEQDFALTTLERPAFMRTLGLILENVDGTDDLPNKFLLRSTPHTLSLATSINSGRTEPPLDALGWSGDGAPGQGELRDFAAGAVAQHYPNDLTRTAGTSFNVPGNGALNHLESFQLGLGRTNEIDIDTLSFSDARAMNGIAVFKANRCNNCHRNAGANNGAGINRNFNTGVAGQTLAAGIIPRDGGFGGQGLSAFNFDTSGDGILDSFGDGTFNTPPLIEAADTAPFFHNNSARTLEDAINFYTKDAFNLSPAGVNNPITMTNAEVIDVARFLRVLNASFNLDMGLQRLEAAQLLMTLFGTLQIVVQNELIQLAVYEIEDANQVLERARGESLSHAAQKKVGRALERCAIAQARTGNSGRLNSIGTAIQRLNDAKLALGPSLPSFTLGNSNLLR